MPRWAVPFRGRHNAYTDAFPPRRAKAGIILDLIRDSLSRPPHAFHPNIRETSFYELLTPKYYRPPFYGVKPIRLGRDVPDTGWLLERYKPPFYSTTPLKAMVPGRLEAAWFRLVVACKRFGLGSFLAFLENLVSNLAGAPSRCTRFFKESSTAIAPLKTVLKAS